MSDEDLTAVDYVLGELDDLERARFERAMQDDPALQAQVNELVPLTDRLGSLSPRLGRMPRRSAPAASLSAGHAGSCARCWRLRWPSRRSA